MKKKAIVVHSGGMDSSLCLKLAIDEHGAENVLALSFTYGQRHGQELACAKTICRTWGVDHTLINLDCLSAITQNSLLNHEQQIEIKNDVPNTLVVGRNGLMARVAAIHAEHLGATQVYMGVIEVEEANSGYRDCSRKYMDLIQAALRLDVANENFEILTPLVKMTKKQTMELGHKLGVLEFLLENTISCYEGLKEEGCGTCPACKLRNSGIKVFLADFPIFDFSYKNKILK
jgi:7-cyano-7-deazaguanine synthase